MGVRDLAVIDERVRQRFDRADAIGPGWLGLPTPAA
jgi:hypothetical protein